MKRLSIGIDPGANGAIVVLDHEAFIKEKLLIPYSSGVIIKNDINLFITQATAKADVVDIFLEQQVPFGRDSATTAFSVGGNYFLLRDLLYDFRDLYDFGDNGICEVHEMTSRVWQGFLFGEELKTMKPKPLAKQFAINIFGIEILKKSDRAKVPHPGIVDASLIGYYGLQKEAKSRQETS